ncbi:hypothetical protein [Spirosoma lituiforme]
MQPAGLFDSLKGHVAQLITTTLPPHKWYTAAYRTASLMAFIRQPKKYHCKSTLAISRAIKLNTLLALLSRQGRAFPIPIHCSKTLDLFTKPRPGGLILCSTHMPLTKLALNYLVELGFTSPIALAADPGIINSIAIWGTTKKLPAIRTGPTVLLKAKNILQQGGTISVMIDNHIGGPYSPNVFHLAEKLNSDIIFADVVLRDHGQIEVRFEESIWNGQRCVSRVQGQMNELYQRTNSLLDYYGKSGYLQLPN